MCVRMCVHAYPHIHSPRFSLFTLPCIYTPSPESLIQNITTRTYVRHYVETTGEIEHGEMKRERREEMAGGCSTERELSYANRPRSQFREYLANVTQSVPRLHPPFIDSNRRFSLHVASFMSRFFSILRY